MKTTFVKPLFVLAMQNTNQFEKKISRFRDPIAAPITSREAKPALPLPRPAPPVAHRYSATPPACFSMAVAEDMP